MGLNPHVFSPRLSLVVWSLSSCRLVVLALNLALGDYH
jgi:hypothetical protein